jgi:8-oxo-dGTP pyrophosphatase MutT (NUDIX family)
MTHSRFINAEFVNFPGGGVEIGEAPMEALKREYMEETGLTIAPKRVLYASQKLHLSTQRPIQIVSVFWLVEKIGGTLKESGNNDDIISLFWADLSNIPTGEMFSSDLEFAKILPELLKPN